MTHGYFGDPANSGEFRGFASPSHEGFAFLDSYEVVALRCWVEAIDGPGDAGHHIATSQQPGIDVRACGSARYACVMKREVRCVLEEDQRLINGCRLKSVGHSIPGLWAMES